VSICLHCWHTFCQNNCVCAREGEKEIESNCVCGGKRERERETMRETITCTWTHTKIIHTYSIHHARTHAIQNSIAEWMGAPLAPQLKVDKRCDEITLWCNAAVRRHDLSFLLQITAYDIGPRGGGGTLIRKHVAPDDSNSRLAPRPSCPGALPALLGTSFSEASTARAPAFRNGAAK
jgi:hypothetical protein